MGAITILMATRKLATIVETTESPFPENQEERFENILAVMNTELKTLFLGFCLDDLPQNESELHKQLSELVTKNWIPEAQHFDSYLHTLVPTGMVIEEPVRFYNSGIENLVWRINEAGKKYGRPIAAFTLKYAVEHGMSMQQILGKTGTAGETRSPYNRIKIITELMKGNLRAVDLQEAINLDKTGVTRHLRNLAQIGLVEYDSANIETQRYALYKWTKGKKSSDVRRVGAHIHEATIHVAAYLAKVGQADRNQIAAEFNRNASDISYILSWLVRQGFASPVKWVGGKILSDARLTIAGWEFKFGYLDMVRNALSGGPELSYMQDVWEDFMENKEKLIEYANKGMKLYESASPFLRRKSADERKADIIKFIEQYQAAHKEGPRTKEIVEGTDSASTCYLTDLIKDGILKKEKEGPAVRYIIK